MRSYFLLAFIFVTLNSAAYAHETEGSGDKQRKACYVFLDEQNQSPSPYNTTGKAAMTVNEVCEAGDHIYIEPIDKFGLAHFVTNICDPAFNILYHNISEKWLAVSCVNSGDKDARQK